MESLNIMEKFQFFNILMLHIYYCNFYYPLQKQKHLMYDVNLCFNILCKLHKISEKIDVFMTQTVMNFNKNEV